MKWCADLPILNQLVDVYSCTSVFVGLCATNYSISMQFRSISQRPDEEFHSMCLATNKRKKKFIKCNLHCNTSKNIRRRKKHMQKMKTVMKCEEDDLCVCVHARFARGAVSITRWVDANVQIEIQLEKKTHTYRWSLEHSSSSIGNMKKKHTTKQTFSYSYLCVDCRSIHQSPLSSGPLKKKKKK